MLEAFGRHFKISDRRNNVTRDLRLLALKALSSPFTRVLSDRWPYEFRAHGLSRPLDAWVSKTMYGVEDASA